MVFGSSENQFGQNVKKKCLCLIVNLFSDIVSDLFVEKKIYIRKIRITTARFQNNTTLKDMQYRFRTKLV